MKAGIIASIFWLKASRGWRSEIPHTPPRTSQAPIPGLAARKASPASASACERVISAAPVSSCSNWVESGRQATTGPRTAHRPWIWPRGLARSFSMSVITHTSALFQTAGRFRGLPVPNRSPRCSSASAHFSADRSLSRRPPSGLAMTLSLPLPPATGLHRRTLSGS